MKPVSLIILFCLSALAACNTQKPGNEQMSNTSTEQHTNKLINESSPYLLQHAHNPVDWYPWGEDALQKAKAENKLLIISIGYAACHWCHVMEHESFEDSSVAALMNEHYVSIKVDREERPDIDQIYMDACQLITGRGGWPLNAIALPDGRPIYAGTYFPQEQWIQVLQYYHQYYAKNPEKMQEQAKQITEGINQMEQVQLNTGQPEFTLEELQQLWASWKATIDFKEGGRRGAPKFPMPNGLDFQLRYYALTGDESALEAVTTTLTKMGQGGIYDHIGGGFARYSVDAVWHVPHFEKMLYDNGQLVSVYSQAYQLTKDPFYKQIVEESLEWIEREMTSPGGGFYSSLDADSEGEEGKYYVWTKDEIDSLLGDDAGIIADYYDVRAKGNWEHTNVLRMLMSKPDFAAKHDIGNLEEILAKAKKVLFEAREQRVRPGLDDKILCSWNALMLKGYVDAYRAFGEQHYLDVALQNAHFISDKLMQPDYRLYRNYKGGKASINAFLDDYALTAEAFIGLYQLTFDEQWLQKAKGLSEYAIQHFFDESSGMLYYTSDQDEALIARKKEIADNVIPGSNSSMAKVLYYLGLYYYDNHKLNMASQMLHNVKKDVIGYGAFYCNWAILMTHLIKEPYEVAIVGPDWQQQLTAFNQHYLPNALFLGGAEEGNLELLEMKLQEGQTTIYVCQNKSCLQPVTQVEAALKQMQ